ncbi:hypothetical protein Pogu_1656 [Pyrobaculum oguniense TE7]|uniref:Uncharacterized protein n=1 Tax=Pyrobaculum oguniense (strain DSM 13380 / JCM 10595 / TE7) TaxID=698757 RepID=H6QAQ7_PYROT|nr:hypothetical protein Pogu_1656 [Pyrobaculum oguniense TE7]
MFGVRFFTRLVCPTERALGVCSGHEDIRPYKTHSGYCRQFKFYMTRNAEETALQSLRCLSRSSPLAGVGTTYTRLDLSSQFNGALRGRLHDVLIGVAALVEFALSDLGTTLSIYSLPFVVRLGPLPTRFWCLCQTRRRHAPRQTRRNPKPQSHQP